MFPIHIFTVIGRLFTLPNEVSYCVCMCVAQWRSAAKKRQEEVDFSFARELRDREKRLQALEEQLEQQARSDQPPPPLMETWDYLFSPLPPQCFFSPQWGKGIGSDSACSPGAQFVAISYNCVLTQQKMDPKLQRDLCAVLSYTQKI